MGKDGATIGILYDDSGRETTSTGACRSRWQRGRTTGAILHRDPVPAVVSQSLNQGGAE
jgi:hypothetical protein